MRHRDIVCSSLRILIVLWCIAIVPGEDAAGKGLEKKPAVEFVKCNIPLKMIAGRSYVIPVTILNHEDRVWKAGGNVRLAYHWLDSNGKVMTRDGLRSMLPTDAGTGGSVHINARVLTPTVPGNYVLQLDLVEESVKWYGSIDKGNTYGATVSVIPLYEYLVQSAKAFALFIFGIFLIVVLPGCIVIVLAYREHFSLLEQVFLSIPVSVSIIGIFAALVSAAGLAFDLVSFSLFMVLLTIVLLLHSKYMHRRSFKGVLASYVAEFKQLWDLDSVLSIGCALLPCLVVGGILMHSMSHYIVPAHLYDANNHSLFVDRIYATRSAMIRDMLDGFYWSDRSSYYPTGMHSVMALMKHVTPLPHYRVLFYFVILISSILPLSFVLLAKRMYSNRRLGVFTAYLSTGFFAFPYMVYTWGGFALITGMFLVLPTVVVGYVSVKRYSIRLGVLFGILLCGAFFAHIAEALTVLYILLFVVSGLLLRKDIELRRALKCIAIPLAFFVLGVLPFVYLLWTETGVRDSRFSVLGIGESIRYSMLQTYHGAFGFGILLYGLIAFGIYCILRQRKAVDYLCAGCFLFLLAFGAAISHNWVINLLALPYRAQYPRLTYNLYFFLPFVAAMGLERIWNWVSKDDVSRIQTLKTGLLFLCLGVLLIQIPAKRIVHRLKANIVNAPVDYDNVRAMRWLEEHTEKGEIVLNDLVDGSFWIDDIVDCRILNPSNFLLGKDRDDRIGLLKKVHTIPSDEPVYRVLNRYKIRFVYYGENRIPKGRPLLNYRGLMASPFFEEVYSTPRTKIFQFRRHLVEERDIRK